MFYSRNEKEILAENVCRLTEENPQGKALVSEQRLAQKILSGIIKKQKEIDQIIKDSAPEWPLPQIAYIDLAILRLAIFELEFLKTEPVKAIIDEAIELGKEYGGESSGKFVNGVLGTLLSKHESTRSTPLA